MSFWDFLDQRVKNIEKNIPWFVNDKLKAYEFYKKNDIPTPEILQVYDTPEDVRLGELPNSFCIKPANMHSAAGVMPLVRLTEDSYFDRLRKRVISSSGIIKEQEAVFDRCKYKSSYKIIIEEGLGHPNNEFLIPFDYKLYTFRGKVGVVVQTDRNSDKNYISFFGESFEPLRTESVIRTDKQYKSRFGHPVVPEHASAMLECAKQIPDLLNTPFVRVDMYSTKKGFYVGEITPAPGGPYYRAVYDFLPEYDARLGELWRNSAR